MAPPRGCVPSLEPDAIGGQAGTSSMIRNCLGFPRGISGGGLAHRAWEQALLFGAQFVFTHEVVGLSPQGGDRVMALGDGSQTVARAVIIATGVTYRRLSIPALDRLIGAGVFYGAPGVEAPAMAEEQVCVVGGANSAGQAALHLAKFASRVTVLVRGESLAASMSDYLITQLKATPNIEFRLRTRVADGHGQARLEGLTLEDVQSGQREQVPAAAVFVMIGAEPRTQWLGDLVKVNDRGFILTGRDVPRGAWLLPRPPLPFETSLPGVFAAGDVRFGSVKRVAGGATAAAACTRTSGSRPASTWPAPYSGPLSTPAWTGRSCSSPPGPWPRQRRDVGEVLGQHGSFTDSQILLPQTAGALNFPPDVVREAIATNRPTPVHRQSARLHHRVLQHAPSSPRRSPARPPLATLPRNAVPALACGSSRCSRGCRVRDFRR